MPRKEAVKPIPNISGAGRMSQVYLELDEVKRLEKVTTNLRDRLLIRLLSHLGCRISEALGITVEDIDFGNSAVSIVHLKTSLKLSCPHCSTGISRGNTFCPKCGVKVVEAIAK
jgi:integrase/recombinase XerD